MGLRYYDKAYFRYPGTTTMPPFRLPDAEVWKPACCKALVQELEQCLRVEEPALRLTVIGSRWGLTGSV